MVGDYHLKVVVPVDERDLASRRKQTEDRWLQADH